MERNHFTADGEFAIFHPGGSWGRNYATVDMVIHKGINNPVVFRGDI